MKMHPAQFLAFVLAVGLSLVAIVSAIEGR
jgi:hypothetical protein